MKKDEHEQITAITYSEALRLCARMVALASPGDPDKQCAEICTNPEYTETSWFYRASDQIEVWNTFYAEAKRLIAIIQEMPDDLLTLIRVERKTFVTNLPPSLLVPTEAFEAEVSVDGISTFYDGVYKRRYIGER